MRTWGKAWIHRQLHDYDLITGGEVLRFALKLSIKSVVIANMANVLIHLVLFTLGLLPYPLSQAIVVGVAVTTVITFVITATFAYAIGKAICELSVSRNALAELSSTDSLSGLLNRRAFFDKIGKYERDAVFILFDIDKFKAVNDVHGHLVGDRVIQCVGGVLREVFQPRQAEVARLGGEEFSVVMSRIPHDGHVHLVEAARMQISAMDIGLGSTRVTVSAGIAEVCHGREMAQSYSMADRALYLAKSSGRNQVIHESKIVHESQVARSMETVGRGTGRFPDETRAAG